MDNLNTKTVKQLRDICYRLQIATLNRNSKWYRDDCDGVWVALSKKNKREVIETIGRYTWEPTKEMMHKNCQFGGLFSDTAGYV